jgi:hypothetical protein
MSTILTLLFAAAAAVTVYPSKMSPYNQAIQDVRTKGSASYFPLNTLTNKELLCALRLGEHNTAIENVAISEEILERMAR